ncbi:MAG: hypothetical protein IT555_01295 [Acetobacteraceae bacterium]|nr:hypothetical protein [Acetobacteraceae bacterium]
MTGDPDFFIGWAGRLPAGHAGWLRGLVASVVAGGLLLAIALARAGDDPGGGGSGVEVTLQGVLRARPYPTITLPPDAGGAPARTVLLSGGGKDGAPFDPVLDGRTVAASGYLLRRGALEMLQVGDPIREAAPDLPVPAAVKLGTWRITGEICDGKCLAGAMRPGIGIIHRACANLCVSGGVPPVFVATAPIEGQTHLLLGDPAGGPLDGRFRALTALPVTLEGVVERRGSLLVFLPDLTRAQLR